MKNRNNATEQVRLFIMNDADTFYRIMDDVQGIVDVYDPKAVRVRVVDMLTEWYDECIDAGDRQSMSMPEQTRLLLMAAIQVLREACDWDNLAGYLINYNQERGE